MKRPPLPTIRENTVYKNSKYLKSKDHLHSRRKKPKESKPVTLIDQISDTLKWVTGGWL